MVMDMCRICFENKGTTDIFDTTEGISISSKIMYCCVKIRIQKEDGFPIRICSACEIELSHAYQFVMKCEAADKKLHSLASFNHDFANFNECDVKSEIKVEDNTQIDFDNSFNCKFYSKVTTETRPCENTTDILVASQNVDTIKNNTKKSRRKVGGQQKCTICEKQCSSPSTLIIHMRTHSDERPYKCHSCDKRYKDSGGLKRHIERNHNQDRKREVICELCGKAFYSYSEVKTHMRTHTGETPYACSLCPSKFTQVGALLRHRLRHTGEKAYSCLKCSKSFHTKVELSKHEVAHTTEKRFNCIICNVRFKYANNLRKHILQHSITNNFICDYCGRTFKTKGNLKIHINAIHSGKSGTCHLCSKHVPNIEVHMWRHTGKRPLKCNLCSSSFFEKKALTRHMNFRHIYSDKYKCLVDGCTDTFPSHPMLQYHVAKFHGSGIPFPCDTCSKGFYRKNDLTRHKLRYHKDIERLHFNI